MEVSHEGVFVTNDSGIFYYCDSDIMLGNIQLLYNDIRGNMYSNEFVEMVLVMYLQGIPVWDICGYTESGDNEINEIIDRYSPYL